MTMFAVLRVLISIALVVLGFVGLAQMLGAELGSAQQFELYFKWAFGAGLVFLAVGFALVSYDKEEALQTDFDDASGQKK